MTGALLLGCEITLPLNLIIISAKSEISLNSCKNNVAIFNPEITSESGSQTHHKPFTLPHTEAPIVENFPDSLILKNWEQGLQYIAEVEQVSLGSSPIDP